MILDLTSLIFNSHRPASFPINIGIGNRNDVSENQQNTNYLAFNNFSSLTAGALVIYAVTLGWLQLSNSLMASNDT